MLAAQGKPADAEAEFRQVLDARLRVLGPDHPDTLTTRHEIARMLADQGKPADAEAESGRSSTPGCGCWAPTTPPP